MNALPALDTTFCLHSALTLLHFLWQGLILAMIACLAGWCLRNQSADLRCRIHAGTLLLMLACLPATFAFLCEKEVRQTPDPVFSVQLPTEPSDDTRPVAVLIEPPEAAVPRGTPFSIGIEETPGATPTPSLHADSVPSVAPMAAPPSTDTRAIVEPITRWTTAAYLIGVGLMFARMLLALSGTQRLRRDAHRIDDSQFLQSIQRRARQFGLRQAPVVAYCDRVAVPALVGLWRPMILLPAVLATGLTPEQLELVITHELAHIRRWDNAWLVAQRMIESILFFHPAVWYVSRRMSVERELCCDEMVIGVTPRRSEYAESLLRVVELTTRQGTVPATATMTSPREGSAVFAHRLMQILGEANSSPVLLPRLWPTLVVTSFVMAAVGMLQVDVVHHPDVLSAERNAESSTADDVSAPEKALTKTIARDELHAEGPLASEKQSPGVIEGQVTPSGRCHDGDGKPIVDAELVLYHLDRNTRAHSVVKRTRTDQEGRFCFMQVPVSLERTEEYSVVATAHGRTSAYTRFPYRSCWGEQIEQLDFVMEKASELRGQVTGPDGAPVQGAMVWTRRPAYQPVVGVFCDLTDDNGNFAIDDLAPLDRDWSKWIPSPTHPGTFLLESPPRVHCRHPDFGYALQEYQSVPGEINFQLDPGAVIEGRVVQADSGEPASDVGVEIVGLQASGGYQQVRTDEQGRYRFTSLRGEKHNIWTVSQQWTATAIDSFEAVAGETREAPELKLVRGATISGRLVHGVTGRPLSLAEFYAPVDKRVSSSIAVKGPDRPASRAGQHAVKFRRDGSFEVRVPPGESKVTFRPPKPWLMANHSLGVERTLALADGQDLRLDLWVVIYPAR